MHYVTDFQQAPLHYFFLSFTETFHVNVIDVKTEVVQVLLYH